jgi:UDP-glucoronosyl and UDP-glucosyl transferase
MANIGVLPHADLPHILPFFRLARELSKLNHQVHLVGSDVLTVGRGHGEAWKGQVRRYGLGERLHLHRDRKVPFHSWLRQVIAEAQLDVLIVDAVWQAICYALVDLPGTVTVVHHAGLPDFRTWDMPTRHFVHPEHSRETLEAARRRNEELESTGPGVRRLLLSLNSELPANSPDARFAFGCGEFAALPAIRAMSLCPAVEFPAERGRIEYLGSLLPEPDDQDWQPPPMAAMQPSQPLIACVFGTTGLLTREEYQWLLDCSKRLAQEFAHCQVITVIPERMRGRWPLRRLPSNLLLLPWIPLWELLVGRHSAKVLVTTPGVGAFRDAVASGTPMIAIPRRADQFGAAARMEYFGLGSAWVSNDLPLDTILIPRIAQILGDDGIRLRAALMADAVRAYDRTAPLKQFIDGVCDGSIRPTSR